MTEFEKIIIAECRFCGLYLKGQCKYCSNLRIFNKYKKERLMESVEKVFAVECQSCSSKPGVSVLCQACLKNREIVERLKKIILDEGKKKEKEKAEKERQKEFSIDNQIVIFNNTHGYEYRISEDRDGLGLCTLRKEEAHSADYTEMTFTKKEVILIANNLLKYAEGMKE
jgi:hypothetical protein